MNGINGNFSYEPKLIYWLMYSSNLLVREVVILVSSPVVTEGYKESAR